MALRLAATSGHDAVVQRLLRDERVISFTPDGGLALCDAALHGHAPVVRSLLHSKVTGCNSWQALALASLAGHCDVVDVLLRESYLADMPPAELTSGHGPWDYDFPELEPDANAFYTAAARGHTRVLERLLQHPGFRFDCGDGDDDNDGYASATPGCPLVAAACGGHMESFMLLADWSAPPMAPGCPPPPPPQAHWQPGSPPQAHWQPGSPPQAHWQPGSPPQAHWQPERCPCRTRRGSAASPACEAICYAAAAGHGDIVRCALQHRVWGSAFEAACYSYYPVRSSIAVDAFVDAAAAGHTHIMDMLQSTEAVATALHHGGNPSVRDGLALRLAATNGHLAVVQRLLADPLVDPAACNSAALTSALGHGRLHVAELLLADPRVNHSVIDPLLRWLAEEERLAGPQGEGAQSLIDRLLTQLPVLRVRLAAGPGHPRLRLPAGVPMHVYAATMGRAAWARRRAAVLGRAVPLDCGLGVSSVSASIGTDSEPDAESS